MNQASNAHSYPPAGQAWYMLGMLFVAYTLSFVDRQIITLMVGPIREDLGISDFEFSLLHGFAFALFFAILGLPVGRLADRMNRRRIVAVGVALWSLMTALCGMAQSFWQLFLARMGVGVGEAALSPSAYSMLSDAFPPAKLTRAIAVYSTGGTLGTGLALIIGGAIAGLIAGAGDIVLPLFGELRPWQASFLIVGLPGLVVAALIFTVVEPQRHGLLKDKHDKVVEPGVAEVLGYLWAHKSSYGALFIITSLMTALSSGFIMWYPSFLIRIHNFSISEAGYSFGALFMVFGTAGVLTGGWLAGLLTQKGYQDANMRVMLVATAMAVVPYIAGPQMPTAQLAMALMGLAIFTTQMIAAVCVAAIQLITPNQMRGQASAVFILLINLLGFGLGASIIASFTDFVFADDMALPHAMSASALLILPPCLFFYWRALQPYSSHLSQAESWR